MMLPDFLVDWNMIVYQNGIQSNGRQSDMDIFGFM